MKSFSGLIFSWQNRSVGDQQQQKAWKSKKVELVWPILIMNKTSVIPRAEFEWNYVGMLVEWSASKLPIKDFLGHISVDLRVHEHLCISLRALWVPPLALVPFLKGANWFFSPASRSEILLPTYMRKSWNSESIWNSARTQLKKVKYGFFKSVYKRHLHQISRRVREQFFEMFSHVESDLFRDLDRLHPPTWENLRLKNCSRFPGGSKP